MAVQTSYPGVYIDEFAPGAPIQGVGTSTAAFVGVAERGDIGALFPQRVPGKIASWDQFLAEFGAQPVTGFHLWYAVRGFFENGGQLCYVVRASNGTYDEWDLMDRSLVPAVVYVARARRPGATAATLQVTVRNLLGPGINNNNTFVFRPVAQAAAVNGRELTIIPAVGAPVAMTAVLAAAQFRPGDVINLGATADRLTIVQVAGDRIRVDAQPPAAGVPPVAIRLANEPVGARTVRLQTAITPAPLVMTAGTILQFTQAPNVAGGVIESVQTEFLGLPAAAGPDITWRVTLRDGLAMPVDMTAAVTVQSEEIDLVIVSGGASVPYTALRLDAAHPRFLVRVLEEDPDSQVRIEAREPPPPGPLLSHLPLAGAAAGATRPGGNENLSTLTDNHFIAALNVLRRVDDVNLVACPDRRTPTMHQELITHCEQLADRFAVLDPPPGLPLFGNGSIELLRPSVDSMRGYAGLYYPWLRTRPAGRGDPVLVPPSGHVCGIVARSDQAKGVFKAPANELVNGAIGVERSMGDIEQGQLNLLGVNVIRVFAQGGRPTLWGARTTATDRNWQYVSTRRLFLYLEESIQEGIRWAVFEPNNLALWQKLRRTISAFLLTVYRDGGLFGETPEKAFYVRIDKELNPFSEQALGRLHIEIGVRPAYPAEFIVVRIGIWDGGSSVTES